MQTNGKVIKCDRCESWVFLRAIDKGEGDGGYSRWNIFENAPEWTREEGRDLCPKCSAEYMSLKDGFFGHRGVANPADEFMEA